MIKRYAFDVIGEIFFGSMFGFLKNSMDHNAYIASLDACMPVLCISAIGPTYLRPLITASSILVPAVFKAVRAMDGIRKAAISATNNHIQDKEQGAAPQKDILFQLLHIVREKGEKANFGTSEATLEAYTAM
jgi:hypothetical protein